MKTRSGPQTTTLVRGLSYSAILALVACGGGLEVSHDYDPQLRFDNYTTYAWSTLQGPLGNRTVVDDFTDIRIRDAIDRELTRAGLTQTELDQAQLSIGYQAGLQQQVERPTSGGQVERYGGTYDSSSGDRWFSEGTLEIGLVDLRMSRVVWRGTALTEMDPDSDPAQRAQRIERAVTEILKAFPPS